MLLAVRIVDMSYEQATPFVDATVCSYRFTVLTNITILKERSPPIIPHHLSSRPGKE